MALGSYRRIPAGYVPKMTIKHSDVVAMLATHHLAKYFEVSGGYSGNEVPELVVTIDGTRRTAVLPRFAGNDLIVMGLPVDATLDPESTPNLIFALVREDEQWHLHDTCVSAPSDEWRLLPPKQFVALLEMLMH